MFIILSWILIYRNWSINILFQLLRFKTLAWPAGTRFRAAASQPRHQGLAMNLIKLDWTLGTWGGTAAPPTVRGYPAPTATPATTYKFTFNMCSSYALWRLKVIRMLMNGQQSTSCFYHWMKQPGLRIKRMAKKRFVINEFNSFLTRDRSMEPSKLEDYM